MPSTAELVCVDPARVGEVWPHAKGLIAKALERTGLSYLEDIEREVLEGKQLLWLAWSDRIEAAATTQLIKGGVCIITACGGQDRDRWLNLFEHIENYARDEGCHIVRIYGRKGWERALSGYRAEYVILEKPIYGRH